MGWQIREGALISKLSNNEKNRWKSTTDDVVVIVQHPKEQANLQQGFKSKQT